ncbi:hypothetical protein ACGXEX_005144, partial [Escherichia coli]
FSLFYEKGTGGSTVPFSLCITKRRSCSANQIVKKRIFTTVSKFSCKKMINIKFQYIHIRYKSFRLTDTDMPRNASAVSGCAGG